MQIHNYLFCRSEFYINTRMHTYAISVSGGSDRAVHMNPLMTAAASGGLDFRSNPELLNLCMNRSGYIPGCPMPNGPNVDVGALLSLRFIHSCNAMSFRARISSI